MFNYFLAFQCVLHIKPLDLPTEIPSNYMKNAEAIISTSYDHSETFSLVSYTLIFSYLSPNVLP